MSKLGSPHERALYAPSLNPGRSGFLLSESNGFGWVHILDALALNQNASSYNDAIDDALTAYRDVYDRLNPDESDVLRSMFRYLEAFSSGFTLPNLENVVITNPPPESMQVKLNNVNFQYDINRNATVSDLSTKAWKTIYFLWLVHTGTMIRDRDMFRIFNQIKNPVSFGLPTIRSSPPFTLFELSSIVLNRLPIQPSTSRINNDFELPCLLANTTNVPFANMTDVQTQFNASSVPLESLNDSNVRGAYLLRTCLIPTNKNAANITTKLTLRLVLDAFDTVIPTADRNDPTLYLAPFQMITQNILYFSSPRTGVIRFKVNDVLAANKTNDIAAGPASFFHKNFNINSDQTVYFTIQDVLSAKLKNNVLIVDFDVDDLMGPSRNIDFMMTPPIQPSEIDAATPFTIPDSEINKVRYPPVLQQVRFPPVDGNLSIIQSGYVFTCSSWWENLDTYHPRKAFNGFLGGDDRWASGRDTYIRATGLPNPSFAATTVSSNTRYVGEWIQIELPSASLVFKTAVVNCYYGLHQFVICASTNGTSWVTLIAQTTDQNLPAGTDHMIELNNNTPYKFYRFIVLKAFNPSIEFSIRELFFSTTTLTAAQSGYQFSASSTYQNPYFNISKVFDGSTQGDNRWASGDRTYNTNGWAVDSSPTTVSSGVTYRGSWIQMALPSVARIFKSAVLTPAYVIHQFVICASNDGNTWTSLVVRTTDQNLAPRINHVIEFKDNNIPYRYYRLIILKNGWLDASIHELFFNEWYGSDVGFKKEDIIMACNDPNTRIDIKLQNLVRA